MTYCFSVGFDHSGQDCELLAEDLEKLVKSYKTVVQLELGEEFPEDPKAQLWGAIGAVFNSWMNQRAKTYRPLCALVKLPDGIHVCSLIEIK